MATNILWLICMPSRGSGGHRTIFNHANYLARAGFRISIAIDRDCSRAAVIDSALKQSIENDFGKIDADFYPSTNVAKDFDLAIATHWTTAYHLAAIKAKKTLYFVQDFEPYFYARGDEYYLSLNSYRMADYALCIGRWLPHKLKEEGVSMPIGFFDFGVNQESYQLDSSAHRENAVCALYQPEKSRRCPNLVYSAISELQNLHPHVKVYAYGSTAPLQINGVTNLGVIEEQELCALYNKCQAGLVISSTNPSRIPFEMMACGLPVVDIEADHTLQDLPLDAATLAKPDLFSVAHKLSTLITDFRYWEKKHKASLTFASSKPANSEYVMFADGVCSILEKGTLPQQLPQKQSSNSVSANNAALKHNPLNGLRLNTEAALSFAAYRRQSKKTTKTSRLQRLFRNKKSP